MERIKIKYADETGRTREDVFDTSSLVDLRTAFTDRGYYILSEEVANVSIITRLRNWFNIGQEVSLKELNEFTKLLRTLLKAGMPLNDAIDILVDGADPTPLINALRQVQEDIREGVSFSKALSRHAKIFPDIFIKIIIAGEKSGSLENMLKRLSEYFTTSIAIRRKIIAAFIYPAILLLVSSVAVSYMVIAVVPEFIGLFESLEVPLPMMTSALLSVSAFIGDWFVLVASLVAVSSILLFKYSKTEKGRLSIDNAKSYIPLISNLEEKYAFSQFSRILSTMIEGGIPLLDSLEVVLDSLENKVIAEKFTVLIPLLSSGTSFGKALKSIDGIPNIMVRVIHVGEESGHMGEMLENLADHYDEEISELTDTITALIEPALFLSMAVVIGTLIIALLYPVLTAASNIQ